jgi:HD-GYP domain-containing protein (c-di-GMP phosphodiesterase class II)
MEDLDLSCFITRLSDKDEPIFIHGKRVAQLACAVANIMGCPGE